jgi:hypothetical protein
LEIWTSPFFRSEKVRKFELCHFLYLLSSVSKHNMWSYYDWIYCCCCPSVNTICGRVMIGLSLSDNNNDNRGFKVIYNSRYFLNFRRYLKKLGWGP